AKAPSDPFSAKPQAAAEGATASAAGGSGVTPVSYDQSTAQQAAPGASLTEEFQDDQPSWWDRTSKSMSSKELKKTYKSMVGRGPDEAVARKSYNEADALFREGKYDEAAKKFGEAADRWPES